MAKKSFGSVYVKLNGAITSIGKLNTEEYDFFVIMMENVFKQYKEQTGFDARMDKLQENKK